MFTRIVLPGEGSPARQELAAVPSSMNWLTGVLVLSAQIMAGARLHPRRDAAMADSVRAFEVLPEIMQQAAARPQL